MLMPWPKEKPKASLGKAKAVPKVLGLVTRVAVSATSRRTVGTGPEKAKELAERTEKARSLTAKAKGPGKDPTKVKIPKAKESLGLSLWKERRRTPKKRVLRLKSKRFSSWRRASLSPTRNPVEESPPVKAEEKELGQPRRLSALSLPT